MSSATAYQLVVGIDIAAVACTACWTGGRAQPSRPRTLSQNPEGYAARCQRLQATGVPLLRRWSCSKRPAVTGSRLRPPSIRRATRSV